MGFQVLSPAFPVDGGSALRNMICRSSIECRMVSRKALQVRCSTNNLNMGTCVRIFSRSSVTPSTRGTADSDVSSAFVVLLGEINKMNFDGARGDLLLSCRWSHGGLVRRRRRLHVGDCGLLGLIWSWPGGAIIIFCLSIGPLAFVCGRFHGVR